MRRYRVLLTESAESDLNNIFSYIAEQSGSARAIAVVSRLEELCASLSSLPDRGNVPKEIAHLPNARYREVHTGPFRIIYRVEISDIFVFCIADGRRDMRALLAQRLSP